MFHKIINPQNVTKISYIEYAFFKNGEHRVRIGTVLSRIAICFNDCIACKEGEDKSILCYTPIEFRNAVKT